MLDIKRLRDFEMARALYREGKIEKAIEKYQNLADKNYAPAIDELRLHYIEERNLDKAEEQLNRLIHLASSDSRAAFVCHLAYRFGWGINEGYEERQNTANMHLQRAAELGDTQAQGTLAMERLNGQNGQKKSYTDYLHWISKAIEGNDALAIFNHSEHIYNLGKDIPDALIEKLRSVAQYHEAAADLIQKIDRAKP